MQGAGCVLGSMFLCLSRLGLDDVVRSDRGWSEELGVVYRWRSRLRSEDDMLWREGVRLD